MSEPRIIKRYANRKLYDTQNSRYVTLEQISEMVRNGEDVTIVDNKTKEDLTAVTLAQIIFEEEKKRSFLPLGTMRTIIQNGGEWIAEAQRRVSVLWHRKDGREDGADAVIDGTTDGVVMQASETVSEFRTTDVDEPHEDARRRGLAALREWTESSRNALTEWQSRMDERIRTAIGGISPLTGLHKDVRQLQERIAELETKLKQLSEEGEPAVGAANPAARSAPESLSPAPLTAAPAPASSSAPATRD